MAAFKAAVGVGLAVFLSVAPYHTDAAIPAEDATKIFAAVNTATTGSDADIAQVKDGDYFDFRPHMAEFLAGGVGDLTPVRIAPK